LVLCFLDKHDIDKIARGKTLFQINLS